MMQRRIAGASAVVRDIRCSMTKPVVIVRSYSPTTKVPLRLARSSFSNEGTYAWEPSDLFSRVLERADRTLEDTAKIQSEEDRNNVMDGGQPPASNKASMASMASMTRELLHTIIDDINVKEKSSANLESAGIMEPENSPADDDDDDLLNYGSNPTITMTALAHALWKSTLRPGKDSAIDATCGNGGDATALAELLFARPSNASSPLKSSSHLVCIDIQQEACQATQTQLSKILSSEIQQHQVTIQHSSHAPLTLPPAPAGPVAVVAFNLGYLPRQERFTEANTIMQTSTTLTAVTDAALCLRLGGVLSVLTYPKTNLVEDAAVQAFVEGLALFSSQSYDWREFLKDDMDQIRRSYPVIEDEAIRQEIRLRLQHIHQELGTRQCWRVHVHEKLGWVHSPRLLTATRVR